jgi:hypothetical protein
VLLSVPVAVLGTVPVSVYVTDPPLGIVTVSAMLPDPDAVNDDPAVPAADQVAPVNAPVNVSDTVAPVEASGPLFETTIEYVSLDPAMIDVTLSVLVTVKSEQDPEVSVAPTRIVSDAVPGEPSKTTNVTV